MRAQESDQMRVGASDSPHGGMQRGVVGADGTRHSARAWVSIWWRVLAHPSVAVFERERPYASWPVVWLSLVSVALADALGVVLAVYGPGAALGYSSLPVGPKLHLPQTPFLPLAALVGSPLQFIAFAALLYTSARLLG